MELRNCCTNTLTFECTVIGGPFDTTFWQGSAFNCLLEEIALLHARYTSVNGAFGQCNNGSLVARSLGTENGRYTSQLNVTVTSDIIGESIECVHDDGLRANIIGSFNNITQAGEN